MVCITGVQGFMLQLNRAVSPGFRQLTELRVIARDLASLITGTEAEREGRRKEAVGGCVKLT